MNKIQLAYIEAKAIEDTLNAEFDRRTAYLWQDEVTNADFVEAVVAEEARLVISEAHDVVLNAEKRLMAWAHERVSTDSLYAKNKADLDRVFANYRKFPSIRPKVIDLCLRLEA